MKYLCPQVCLIVFWLIFFSSSIFENLYFRSFKALHIVSFEKITDPDSLPDSKALNKLAKCWYITPTSSTLHFHEIVCIGVSIHYEFFFSPLGKVRELLRCWVFFKSSILGFRKLFLCKTASLIQWLLY